MAVALADPPMNAHQLAEENVRLAARVKELEHQLELERSRNKGLEKGLSALSERVVTLRKQSAAPSARAGR
jgi:phage shock protein A